MPQLAGAAAAWAVTAWTSAVTVVNTAMVAAAGAALPGLSFGAQLAVANFATKAAVFGGLAAASAALMRPNIPSSGTSLDFKPDPKAPIRGAMGYTALGGNKVFQATWGYKRVAMSLGVALSLGPIDQVPRFEADGATVTFSGPQNEATGFYAADMWQRTTLGLPGDAALLPPTGLKYGNPGLTGWGTQHAAPQVSFSFWTMVLAKNPEDRDVFTNGVPDPRWIGRWMKLWDPRKDSTYPGGSGPQRRDDWRTWEWSESPYVHALAWVRGHYKLNLDGTIDRSKRIAGIGAPDAAIDIPAFVEGMNVAQANNWTISGEWSTSDGKFQTLLAMLQAGGGEPISRGAQISVMVNAPRVATYTYTRDDLIGQAEIRPLTPRRERKNTIVPRYKSEANGWQYVPAGEVTSSVYRDEDRGEPRSLEIEYTHVRSAKQAGQLAAYDLANLREGLTVTLPSKVHLMHVHPGDCITVDVPELALSGQKFIVRRATVNHQAASVTLELRSESDGKHAWALGQAAQPAPSPSLSAVDPKYVPPPAPEDWTAVPKPPGSGGVSQPIVIIELPIETTDIVAVIIKHGPSAAGPWTDGYEGSPRTDGRYEVAGLTPGQTYCFSLQYVAKNGAKSEPDIKCGIVAGDLTAGNVVPTAPTIVAMQDAIDAAEAGLTALDAAIYTPGTGLLARSDAMFATLNTPTTGVLARLTTVENKQTSDNSAAINRINALEATVNTPTTGLVARMGVQETATANLQTGKADVSRVTALEAKVDTPGTGLLARMASQEAATVNLQTGKADASRVAVLEAAATGGSMNQNPTFMAWSGALPDTYGALSASNGAYTKVSGQNGQPNAVRMASAGTADFGLNQFTEGARDGGEWVVLEVDVALVAGSFAGAGVQIQARTATSALVTRNYSFFTEFGAGTPGRAYRLSKLADLRSASAVRYGVNAWTRSSVFGPSGAATIDWRRLSIRPASEAEIASGTVLPDVQSRVGTLETATANLQTGKADASRVTSLEATVNTPGTGLTARLTTVESVAASANGTAKAIKGVVLDVNGYVSGYSSINDGTTSQFEILASVFGIRDPGSGERTEYRAGNWYVYSPSENTRTRYGKAFGGTQKLVWWTGPTSVAEGSETKANAYVYMSQNTVSGPRFGGEDIVGGSGVLTATASSLIVQGGRNGAGGVSTSTTTVTASGGNSGASIRWVKVSGDDLVANSPSSFTTSFYGTVGTGQSKSAVFMGVVTKAGQQAAVYVQADIADNGT